MFANIVVLCMLSSAQTNASIDELSDALYGDSAKESRSAKYKLVDLRDDGNGEQARAAKVLLKEYEQRRTNFLNGVGNDCKDADVESLTYLRLISDKEIPVKEMKYLYTLHDVSQVSASAKNFSDDHLRYLGAMSRLEILSIRGGEVSGKELANLTFPRLSVLEVENCPIADDAFLSWSFSTLAVLNLKGTKITNAAIEGTQMVNLESLSICNTSVTKDLIRSLRRFPKLKQLRIDLSMFDPILLNQIRSRTLPLTRLKIQCDRDDLGRVEEIRVIAPEHCTIIPIVSDK